MYDLISAKAMQMYHEHTRMHMANFMSHTGLQHRPLESKHVLKSTLVVPHFLLMTA